MAVGRCIEHYGAGEAYLPVLEVLGRLCREQHGNEIIAVLRQHAPSWLVQMPSLLSTEQLEELQRQTAGVTRERMLRELAEALEVITAERPLVLILEDLHWSDVSTLDLLSMLARRQEMARLLIVGTYRPVEVLTRDHPLKGVKQELQLHGRCEELALDFLSEAAIVEYLEARFFVGARRTVPLQQLAKLIHRRTDGNPLFMVNLVDHLLSQGALVQVDGQWLVKSEGLAATVPKNLRQLIEQQIERVSPEAREVLEVASVAGAEFSAAAVAAGAEQLPETVEAQCEALVRREQFLRTREPAEWPDGTVAARYQFLHALYQEVFYERIPAARRSRLHRLIGERTEAAYGTQVREIAAELAVHFERGRDTKRAIRYLQQAGENARRRSAHQEASSLLIKGLELLKTLPDTPERVHQELTLQLTLGASQLITKGYASREVEHTYSRARELCRQVGETPQLFTALGGLWQFHLNRAEFQTVCELGEELLTLAQNRHAPDVLLMAHDALGKALHWCGELAQSQTHVERVVALYDPQQHRSLTFLCAGEDPGVVCLTFMAWNLWLLGYAEQALGRAHQALVLAQEVSSPFDIAVALWGAAVLHQWRGDRQQVQERAEAMVGLSAEQGFSFWLAYGTMLRGWALAEQGQVEEGIAQLQQGLAACRATGTEGGPIRWLPWLAAAYAKVGQAEKGLAVLAEALARVDKTGMRFGEAELYRLKGELTLQQFTVPASKFKVEESVVFSAQTNQKAKACPERSRRSKGQKPILSGVEGAKITSPRPLAPNTQRGVEQEAEGYFLKAIEIAQRQQAKAWELRASMSLTCLWQRQGKKKQAHTMLSEVYDWFTEGFDTKDLQEAKALLEELSH
jgi:predicted ATPase